MNQPSPALVAQDAVRRLPRWALWLLCLAYVIPGYVGRDPWRAADMATFGTALELAAGSAASSWLHPGVLGMSDESGALLPYWLGAWALQWLPTWVAPELAVRLPFALMLAGTLVATWFAVHDLALHRGAQPVAFAFGGEAGPVDYARALADGGLLALVATLGLAQFSHETSPPLAQLFFGTLVFLGLAALPFRPWGAPLALLLGLPGLVLSGAPATALIYGGVATLALLRPGIEHLPSRLRWRSLGLLAAITLGSAALAWGMVPPNWQLIAPASWRSWRSLGQLFLWFTWPAWPLVLWTLWRWRLQLPQLGRQRHLGLPILIAVVPLLGTVLAAAGDRTLLLALPALAALAALALPTFKRSASALIDWFTVLFFSSWAIVIWVVWIAMQTGVPAKPAANVAKLAPGFEPVFQGFAFGAALLGTLAWLLLARWRTGRHRPALWKSLVLPAAGATLCWLLLMTLWLPALNYGRGYAAQVQALRQLVGTQASCVQVHGLSAAQVSALRFHAGWDTEPARGLVRCPWLIVDRGARASLPAAVSMNQWRAAGEVDRPTAKDDQLLVYRRIGG